jgi:dolichol-phosphate mannosyltransferase
VRESGVQEADGDPPAKVTVLVPTRGAADIGPLLRRLDPVLAGLGGEILVAGAGDKVHAAVAAAARTAAVPVRLVHQTPGGGGVTQDRCHGR